MAGGKNLIQGLFAVAVVAVLVYLVDPTMFGLLSSRQGFYVRHDEEEAEKFANMNNSSSNGTAGPGQMNSPSADRNNIVGNPNVAGEGFADLSSQEGPANFGSTGSPAGCYPRDQLTPSELLPKSQNSVWAEQNPMGPGSLKGKNFLSAGALIGVNTVGQSLRNANLQLRSEPPNPQVAVSIFNQSTIAPDTNRRPLEIN